MGKKLRAGMTVLLALVFRALGRLLAFSRSMDVKGLLVAELVRDMDLHSNGRCAEVGAETACLTPGTDRDSAAFELVYRLAGQSSIEGIHEFMREEVFRRIRSYDGSVGRDNEPRRAQWVERTLKSLPSGFRLLDAGAGEQQYRKHCDHLIYVSQDFSQYDGAGDRSGLQTGSWSYGKTDIVCDICAIPEPDGAFDAVLCTEVFEHITDPIAAIREFARLLKSGGTLVLTAPFASLTHFAPHFYYTGFSKFFFKKILADHNFYDISIEESGGYFDYLSQELNRLPSVIDRYAGDVDAHDLSAKLSLIQEALDKCAMGDQGSAELLCYGLHVVARKM